MVYLESGHESNGAVVRVSQLAEFGIGKIEWWIA